MDIIGMLRSAIERLAPAHIDIDTASGNEVRHYALRDGYSIVSTRAQSDERNHILGDIDSVVNYCIEHGGAGETTVFVCDSGINVELRDVPGEGPGGDRLQMPFSPSVERVRLGRVLGENVAHRDFVRHFDLLRSVVAPESGGFLAEMRTLKGARAVEYDATIGATNSVTLKVTDGVRGAAELPDEVVFALPAFVGVEERITFRARLSCKVDKDGGVWLRLDELDLSEALERVVGQIAERLSKSLPEYLVVTGRPRIERKMGEQATLFSSRGSIQR